MDRLLDFFGREAHPSEADHAVRDLLGCEGGLPAEFGRDLRQRLELLLGSLGHRPDQSHLVVKIGEAFYSHCHRDGKSPRKHQHILADCGAGPPEVLKLGLRRSKPPLELRCLGGNLNISSSGADSAG